MLPWTKLIVIHGRSAIREIRRFLFILRNYKRYDEDLNNRVHVEQVLFDVAAGKKAPLTPRQCRSLALKLGIPDEIRRGRPPDQA